MKRFGTITIIDLLPPIAALERATVTLHSRDMMIGPVNGRWMIRFTRPRRGEPTEAVTVGVALPELPDVTPVAPLEALATAWEGMAEARHRPGLRPGEGAAYDTLAGCARQLREAITCGGAG